MNRLRFILLLAWFGCTSTTNVRRVETYRAAQARGDLAAASSMLSPEARMWYEKREGPGEPLRAEGGGRYEHWDKFFHSTATLSDWKVEGDAVSAVVHEINDFYRLLDWRPKPYEMTWWFDGHHRIAGAMVRALPGKATSRMDEFQKWAAAKHAGELGYLMPGGKLDPTGDRAERWKALLTEWRVESGLPPALD